MPSAKLQMNDPSIRRVREHFKFVDCNANLKLGVAKGEEGVAE